MHCGGKEHAYGVRVTGLGERRGRDRQTAVEAQAGKRWIRERNRDERCSEVCHSRLTTSPHPFLPPHGLENQRDQRLQGNTFRNAYIIFGYCLQGFFSSSNLSLRKQVPAGVITGHTETPMQGDIIQRGRPLLPLMCSLINIYQKPVA